MVPSPQGERLDANAVVLALGTAFGQHVANGLGLRWVIASNDHGTDIALHGQPGEMLVFPVSSIAKRCESREFDCFAWLYDMLRQDIENRRALG